MSRQYALLATSAAALLLSACGGGGDTATPTAGAALTLDSGNYERAAIEAAASGIDILDFGTGGSSLLGADAQPLPNWVALGRQELVRAQQQLGVSALPTLTGAVTTRTSGCRTYSVDDKNNNQTFDAGDSVSITAKQCVESGETLNGTLTILLNSETGSASSYPYALDITLGFSGFSATTSSLTASAEGSLRLVSAFTSATAGRDTMSTSGFQVSAKVGNTTYSRTVTNFTGAIVTQGSEWITTMSGTVTSNALDGRSLVIATPTPFKRRNTDAYPYVGVATVTGANGGKATLTTLSTSQVSISLDANGDGTAETNVVKAWSAVQ